MNEAYLTCRVCLESRPNRKFVAREMMFGTREQFEYFQCSNCGCLQISSIPEEPERYYPDEYYSFQFRPANRKNNPAYQFLVKQRCRTALFGSGFKLAAILKHLIGLPKELYQRHGGIPTGEVLRKAGIGSFSARFLDVGCGSYSPWLDSLSGLGFKNLIGVDPFIRTGQYYNSVKILKDEISRVEGKFDLITFHHSLEHMPDQLVVLNEARRKLAKGGVCLIRVPLVSSFAWEKYGVNWVELDAPRHLYLHSHESIRISAERAGMELIETVFDSVPFEFYGSEQYTMDIALNDDRSVWTNPDSSLFSPEKMEEFEALARKVNAEGRGGRAGFYFRSVRDL